MAKAPSGSGEGNGSGSSASSGGAGSSTSCAPDEGLLRNYVEAHEAWRPKDIFSQPLTIEVARASWYERLGQEMYSVGYNEQMIAQRTREREKG